MSKPEVQDFCDRIDAMIGALASLRDHLLGCDECVNHGGCDAGEDLLGALDQASNSFDNAPLVCKGGLFHD